MQNNKSIANGYGVSDGLKKAAHIMNYVNPLTAFPRLASDVGSALANPEETKSWVKSAAGVVGDAVSGMFSDKDSYTGIKDSELPNHISKRSKSFKTLSDEDKTEHLKQKFYLLSGKKDKPGEGMAQTDYLKSIANSKPVAGGDVLTGSGQTINTNLYGYTQDEIDYANKVIKNEKDNIVDTKKKLKEVSEFAGKKIKDAERNKNVGWVAKKLYDDAKDMADAPFRGDLDDTNAIANYGRGVKSGARAENIPFAGAVYSKRVEDETQEALRAFNKAQENWAKSHKQGDEMTAEDVKKAIGEDKFEIVSAAYTLAEVSQMRENNMSLAYQSGQSLAQSLSMMAEMLIARKALGRVFGKVGKMDRVLDKKMARNWKSGNYGRAAGDFMQQRFINAPSSAVATVPMAVKNVEQAETEKAMQGEEMTAKDYISATADAAIETFTETGGGKLLDIGNDALKKQAGRAFKSTLGKTKAWKFAENMGGKLPKDFKRYVNFVKNTDIANEVLQSPISEYQEEFLGAGLGLAKGTLLGGEYYEDAKDEMAYMLSREGNVVTAGSVLPMTLLPSFVGGGLKMAAAKRSAKAVGKYGKMLTDQIDKMDISDDEKSEKKKKLADYITSRQGNLDDNEAEYIAGQIGLDAQSISTLKRYANSVKSYYETGDIDTLTKDMSEEDKQSVGAMLAAWWKVRFDGANERYNNYVSAKDNLRKATEARDELVKNLGGKKSAIARLQELYDKYKNGSVSSEEEAELRVLMNVDVQEAEERYMDAYELMRNPNVKTKQESSEQQEEQPAEQARKVTKVKYTTNHNGTTVVSTITDEDGFTDEEIRRGVVVKNHPNATLENDRTAEPIPLSQTGLSKVHVELSDEDKSQREEERRAQEEREKEERRQKKAESRAAKREEERARIESFPEMIDKSAASWIRRNYTPNEVTTEDGIADDIADMLGDESDGDTMTNKLESVAEFINPELIDIFRSLARKVDDGTISVKDFVSAFGVNQEQNNAESAEVERKSENLGETIEGMDAVEARELLRTKVGELTEVMRKESMAIANLQSQVDSDKASDELKARQSENIKTHREVLKKAEEDYQAVMTTIMSMDEGLFNELSSAPVKSSSEARALEALGVRVDERKKDEANPNRAGMTKDGKDILDGVNAMREQGKSDEQIAQELAAEYEHHDRLVTDIKGQLNGKVLLSESVNLQRSMAYHEKVLGEILSIAEQQGGSVEESFFNAIEENEIDGVPERLEKTQNEASAKDEADAVIEDMAKNNPAGLISMADNQIEKTLSDLSKKMLRRHDIEEGNVAADVNDLAKILKDIKKLNANLEKWENIRQQYSEDGKSMKEGTLSAEERMKIELNNRENNKEQVADTQEERVEQKETTEERKARKLKVTEERRAAELKEKQKQAEETLAAAREKYEAEKAAEESDTEEQSELPTSSESPVIEETDSAEEENESEETGEAQEIELLSDKEIAKYENDIFYGLFDGEQDIDDRYLNQACSDLEQTEGQIEEKKAKVSNAEEIIKEMEEDPDYWTSNGVDPNEGIVKYKESIAKLSGDIEWLNKTKAETERYIASKEAQMRANEKKGSNESGGENTVDVAELSRSFLDIMNKWFNERRYSAGKNKGFRHTSTVREKMVSAMVGIRPDGMAASKFTEKELNLMNKIAEACDEDEIDTAGEKRKINAGKENEKEVEITDISDEIREKISKAWAKVTEEEINDGNTDAENAMKNLMNKLIYGVDEEEKEEGADAGEKEPLTQKEKDNLESEMKKYLKRRFDGEQRDARFEDEDGTLYIDYGEGKQKVYFKKFARGFSLRTSPNEEYYDSVESWKNKDEKKKEQDRVSRGDVKTQEEYEKWQRRQALGVQVPNGKMALIFQSKREIEGAVKRNDGSYSVTNAMMEKLVNGKLTEADFGLDGDLPVRTFNEFVNAIKRASGIDYSDPLIASAIRLSIKGMNNAANNGFGNGTDITVEKKDHLNSSEAKDEIWNENFKDTKYEITEHNGVYYLSNHEYKNPNEAGIKLRERIIGDLKAKGIKVGSDEYAAAVKARKESMETQGLLKLSLNDAMKVLDRLTMEKPQTEEEKEEEDKIVDDDIETTGDELDAYQSSEYDRKVSTEGVYDSENSDIVNDHLSQWDEEKKTKAKPAATKKRTKAEAAAIKKLNEFVEKKEEAMADYQKARKEGNKEAQKEAIERQKKINKEAQAFAKVNGIDWRAEGYSFHIDKKNIITETAKRYGKQMMSHIKKVANASKGKLTSSSFSEMMKGDPRGEFAKAVKEYARANHITPAQAAKELMEQRGEAKAMFLGEKGAAALDNAEEATIRLDNLRVARDMESAGKDAKTIKIATGWERGADGKWRYETGTDFDLNDEFFVPFRRLAYLWLKKHPDQSKYLGASKQMLGMLGIDLDERTVKLSDEEERELSNLCDKFNFTGFDGFELPLFDVIKDTPLYKAYEGTVVKNRGRERYKDGLRKHVVRFELMPRHEGGRIVGNVITLNAQILFDGNLAKAAGKNNTKHAVKSVLAHEIQHAIQEIEGFSEGADEVGGFENYRKTTGEVESRNVERRLGMSAEERRNTLASETEDVAREDQIFLEENLGQTGDNVQLMEGSDGTVYGWCEIERDAEGNVVARHIYLNDEELNANTMVHELGHLWLNLLSEINPKMYERGLSLAKQHPLFAELKASDEYGMLSDDEIADEVLARMIGDRFEVLTEFAETKYSSGSELKNVISALRRFFVDMFKSIKSAFGEWTDEEIDNTTLTDIATSAVRDIISGKTVEEWAAKTISDDVHEKLRNTSQPSLTVDEVEKAISIAEKLSVKHGAANFIQNFCKVLTKKGRGTFVTEAIDNNKPILLLYKAIDRFRRSIGMDGLDMKECPYYDYEAIGQTIKTESSDANQRLIENGIKKTTTAAVEVLSKLKLRNGEEIGKEKARKLLDIYLMSHSAVERKQKGYNTRSAEALLSSSDVSWIKEIDGFENVSNEDTLVESVIRLQALNTDVKDAINNQWEAIRAITSYYRDLLYDSGYISADLRNEWSNEYYVPNKGVYGDKEDEDDDRDSILDELISRGLIEGDRSKNSARSLTTRSKGGESFGEDCIANLISQMDAAIRVSTVNRFRLKIFKDLIDNSAFGERTGLFTIRKGEARTDDKRARSIVMVGGETYTIDWGSEENYAIADAVNGSKNRIKVLRNTTNGLRAFGSTIFTTLNVSFVLSEIKRQYLTRASQMYMTFAEKYGVKKAVAKWAESFFRPDRYIRVQKTLCAALLKHESDSDIANKSGIMRYFNEFQMYAGNAGFTTSEAFVDYMSLKDISKEISGIGAGVNKHSASIYLKKIYNAFTLIQRTNDVTNRYLAFAMLMESGWTARDAARVSRNVGPNFLRGGRGEYGFAVPSQYSIFYNATLQGQMNALSKYFGRTTFDGEYLSKKRYVRKLAASSLALSLYAIYGYLVGQTGVGLILSMFGGDDDDDDKKNHGIKEEAWLKGSRDKDFAYSGIMRYADDSGPWLKILTTIPEEDRVIFTIGVNVALRENGLITESELCSRVAKACVDGAIPISNVFKGLAYGVIDAADNFINGKGKDLEAIMISNFANGVLNDISAPVEMMGFWLDDKKYVEDVADRDDAASKLPNFAYSYTEGGHYFANKIAMNDARFADFFAYGSGIVTTIDKNLELLGIDDDTRVSKYEQEQFKKYASSEAKQIDAGRIKIDRGNVYKLNEITKNLGRLSELKWELNPEEKEMYEVVTGDNLKKKKTVNYSLTKNDLLEAKEISKFYVDYSSSIKDENIVLSPEAYSEKIKMKQEEFKNKPRKRKLAVLSLAKRVFADKAKTDLYEDNFNKTMDYCDEYRKSHNDEPSNLEVAIVCKLYGKYIKDLGKAAKDAINVATIKLLPDDLWKPNLMNVGELSKDNVKAKEYLSSESYDAKLEDNASFVSRYENVTEQIREELFKLTEYRDSRK